MTIKFISDSLGSKDREEIKNIITSLNQNPLVNQRANLLRNMTLAAIDTFREVKTYHPQIKEVNINVEENFPVKPKLPERFNLDKLRVPQKIDIPLDLYLEAPEKIIVPRELIKEAPPKELFVNAPEHS